MQTVHEELDDRRADLRAAQAKLESLHGRSRAIFSKAVTANRELTAEEQRQVDQLAVAFDAAEANMLAIKADIEALMSTPQARQVRPGAIPADGGVGRIHAPSSSRASAFANLFHGRPAADPYAGKFESLGDFALAVHSGNDARLMRNSALTPMGTTSGADGGFLVPQQLVQMLMDQSLLREVVRPRANVIPIGVGQAVAAGFSSLDGTGSKRAGLALEWASEHSDLTHQKAKAREIGIFARKGSIFCAVSNELVADAPNFDRLLTEAMVAALSAGLDYAFISGLGAGQPLGMINGLCTITVDKEGSQAANTLLIQNLSNMMGRLSPASYGRAVWFIHPTLVPLLYQMSYVVKNVLGTENVGGAMVHPISVGADGQLRCFGLPMIVTDACSVLSAKGDIILADVSRYLIALRQDVTLARDNSVYFGSDEIAFKLTIRLDGLPEDGEPTKLRDGTNTVSPFVTLAAR